MRIPKDWEKRIDRADVLRLSKPGRRALAGALLGRTAKKPRFNWGGKR